MKSTWVRTLAFWQFTGGLLAMLGALQPQRDATSISVHLPLVTAIVGAIASIAGVLLFLGERIGSWLSLAVQLAQVLSFNLGWRYVFLAGPKLTLILASTGTVMTLGGGGLFYISSSPQDGTLNGIGLAADASFGFMESPLASSSWTLGINLLAVYYAIRLSLLLRSAPRFPVVDSSTSGAAV